MAAAQHSYVLRLSTCPACNPPVEHIHAEQRQDRTPPTAAAQHGYMLRLSMCSTCSPPVQPIYAEQRRDRTPPTAAAQRGYVLRLSMCPACYPHLHHEVHAGVRTKVLSAPACTPALRVVTRIQQCWWHHAVTRIRGSD
jgi:uncharacterized protein with PIN domain